MTTSKFKYQITALNNDPILCNSLQDLTESQKQDLTSKFLDRHPLSLENTVVEYILQKSFEDQEAPFSHDDITNNTPTGSIEINGYWLDLTEDDRDQKVEFYEYLRDKAESINDNRLSHIEELEDQANESFDNDQTDQEKEFSRLVGIAETKQGKSQANFDRLDLIVDSLNDMDFENYPEIYQWFSVDSYLAKLLDNQGECILDWTYWGRTCCGQSVVLDHVMQKIAFDYFVEGKI